MTTYDAPRPNPIASSNIGEVTLIPKKIPNSDK